MTAHIFGPILREAGVEFRLWAPAAQRVDLLLDGVKPMTRDERGWYTLDVPGAKAGALYGFRIDDKTDVPDPASHFQPHDIKGQSQVFDHTAYRWRTTEWRGRPWHETVLMECHVGAFTAAGTYLGVADKLHEITDTGITALELMPINDFPGERNWGYDGTLWYAPDHSYGSPDNLKYLIDKAHGRDLMVFLDVVYNHFGPEGNYLGMYAPEFFRDAHTPWGVAINYENETVRSFAIQNALHWLDTYRFDGLRLDAVHAVVEPGGLLLLEELSKAVGELAKRTGRYIHLVLENDDNRSAVLDPKVEPPTGQYRAQWNDDYHHAWHVLLTGETHGYYRDYKRETKQTIATMLRQGFAYQGQASEHRGGKLRGQPSGKLSPLAFVNFLQNHDQIGNRALGDRLEWSGDPKQIEAGLAILLLAPMIPMIFMGEEWGSRAPFPFFCDFKGDLADAVRTGRRREFAEAYETYGDEVPEPFAEETLRAAVLNWNERETSGRKRLDIVKSLLRVRRDEIVPHLKDCAFGDSIIDSQGSLLTATWRLGEKNLLLAANLSDRPLRAPAKATATTIWGDEQDDLDPWAVRWLIKDQ